MEKNKGNGSCRSKPQPYRLLHIPLPGVGRPRVPLTCPVLGPCLLSVPGTTHIWPVWLQKVLGTPEEDKALKLALVFFFFFT